MPIYEYKCSHCGHRFDILQHIGEDGTNLTCPECGTPKPEKMFSAFASGGASSVSSVSSGSSCSSFG